MNTKRFTLGCVAAGILAAASGARAQDPFRGFLQYQGSNRHLYVRVPASGRDAEGAIDIARSLYAPGRGRGHRATFERLSEALEVIARMGPGNLQRSWLGGYYRPGVGWFWDGDGFLRVNYDWWTPGERGPHNPKKPYHSRETAMVFLYPNGRFSNVSPNDCGMDWVLVEFGPRR